MKKEEFNEYDPLVLRSSTMSYIMYEIDERCFYMEEKINFLEKELKASQE